MSIASAMACASLQARPSSIDFVPLVLLEGVVQCREHSVVFLLLGVLALRFERAKAAVRVSKQARRPSAILVRLQGSDRSQML